MEKKRAGTEAQQYVWEGAIPLQIHLHDSEVTTVPPPPSALILAPRLGYLPLLAPQIKPYFSSSLPPGADTIWFEYKGLPLKWYIPTGVLFDLLCAEPERPWNLTVHFRGYPGNILTPCEGEDSVKWSFINSLKEAAYIINGNSKNIMNMSQADQIDLWRSVLNGQPETYLRISSKLKLDIVGDDFSLTLKSSASKSHQSANDAEVVVPARTAPGFLAEFPWKKLGSYKYLILAPCAMQSLYIATMKRGNERDYTNLLIIPVLIVRAITCLIWTSVSRHRTAKGKNKIVDRSVEFEQVDRENAWDDQILLAGLVFYIMNNMMPQASFLPIWRTDGIIITFLLHVGPLEYLYYWFHRALHHHYLYSRYHSHHHSFIVTDPNDGLVHPFAENLAYLMLFGSALIATALNGTASLVSFFGYPIVIDFMNNLGHCNFEFIPPLLFSIFPPLKYLMYTPSFHSLHHTQFRTNYSLFMPFYDWIHGTMDKTTDVLYEESLNKQEDFADVVHLTHLTTPDSVFHLRLGLVYFASRPHISKLWYMWPLTFFHMILNFMFGQTFITETNSFDKLKLQFWVVPKYRIQYFQKSQKQVISGLIEKAVLDAEARDVKVMSLGLLNQGEDLNMNGELYIRNNPNLKIKIVDGSSLAVAIVINSIPKGTTEVLFRGRISKVSNGIVSALCNRGVQVATFHEHEWIKLSQLSSEGKVVLSKCYTEKVWIVGDDVTINEQLKAPKGTLFIPFSQFIPKKVRKHDCIYALTPSMVAPASLKNLHSCENWLPRRVISAPRVAGILHALEGWDRHECGKSMSDIDTVWEACLKHGFRPSTIFI